MCLFRHFSRQRAVPPWHLFEHARSTVLQQFDCHLLPVLVPVDATPPKKIRTLKKNNSIKSMRLSQGKMKLHYKALQVHTKRDAVCNFGSSLCHQGQSHLTLPGSHPLGPQYRLTLSHLSYHEGEETIFLVNSITVCEFAHNGHFTHCISLLLAEDQILDENRHKVLSNC